MKTKFFTLLLAVAASIGTMFAWDYERVQIGDLYYNLDATNQTAEVTSQNGSNPYWSTTITTAIIPASVEYNSVTYSVTSIGDHAFDHCTGLTSVTIPNSVTSIGWYAFSSCSSLTSVTIPNSVTSIGWYAFSGCSGLTSVTIPNSVTNIVYCAFSGCSGLISIKVESNNTKYDSRNNCNAIIETTTNKLIVGCQNTVIPNSVTSIGRDAFYRSKLTSITIPNSVISIGSEAFSYCTGLTSGTIGNSVTSIGDYAFRGCSSLTSVTIPNNVTSIGRGAFQYCYGLTSVEIPNSVISFGEAPFQECLNLTSITVAADNPNYISEEGVLFDKDKDTLIQYPLGNTRNSYMISNTVTRIGEFAFFSCNSLTSVTIPGSVTSIGGSAFSNHNLTSIICEAINPPTLGNDVFNGVVKSIPLYVPAGSVDAYQAADQWKDFTNILALPETEEVNCNIHYVDKDAAFVSSEQLTFNVPEAPAFDGFTFLRWEFVGGPMSDGLTIRAIYEAEEPTSAPAIYTNPANPAQKLIRDGNVYILKGDKTYTLQGQVVR